MFRLLGTFFIALGVVLITSYSKATKDIKSKKNNKKNNQKIEELKKTRGSGVSFIFAGVSILCLDIALKFMK